MKNLIMAILAFTSMAHADFQEMECCTKNIYIECSAGVNFMQNYHKTLGATGSISIGYKFQNNFCINSEFSFRDDRISSNSTDRTYAVMGNVIYNIDLGMLWTPYIGAGVGYSYSERKFQNSYSGFFGLLIPGGNGMYYYNYKQKCIAYQAIAGLDREIVDALRLGIEYRCFWREEVIRDHSVLVSVKQYF